MLRVRFEGPPTTNQKEQFVQCVDYREVIRVRTMSAEPDQFGVFMKLFNVDLPSRIRHLHATPRTLFAVLCLGVRVCRMLIATLHSDGVPFHLI